MRAVYTPEYKICAAAQILPTPLPFCTVKFSRRKGERNNDYRARLCCGNAECLRTFQQWFAKHRRVPVVTQRGPGQRKSWPFLTWYGPDDPQAKADHGSPRRDMPARGMMPLRGSILGDIADQ